MVQNGVKTGVILILASSIVARYTLNEKQKLWNGREFSFYQYKPDNDGFGHLKSRRLTISSVISCVYLSRISNDDIGYDISIDLIVDERKRACYIC